MRRKTPGNMGVTPPGTTSGGMGATPFITAANPQVTTYSGPAFVPAKLPTAPAPAPAAAVTAALSAPTPAPAPAPATPMVSVTPWYEQGQGQEGGMMYGTPANPNWAVTSTGRRITLPKPIDAYWDQAQGGFMVPADMIPA